jgi:hypothetical protein
MFGHADIVKALFRSGGSVDEPVVSASAYPLARRLLVLSPFASSSEPIFVTLPMICFVQDSGLTPLCIAAGKGHSAVVTVLLEHGAAMDLTSV